MASFKRNKSGGTQSEGAQSNSASPASSVALSNHGSTQNINNNAPKYGTLVPNRIFVGGISSNTTEVELCQLFSKYGNVKATKIIADRAGVSKGYGFVTFESEEEVKYLIQDSNNIVLKERRLNIAPAIKKQPFNRSFETSSPPPPTPNLYYSHNGVPYTFHNGMAFFPPTAHQPAIAALPPADPTTIYPPPYGPAQNGPPPYGTPMLVPAPAPVFVPQNYPYQPMPMTNGTHQFIYPGSGSSNSSSGSPLAGTPDNPHLPQPMPAQYFQPQFPPQEAFYPSPIYISYNTYSPAGDYETHEQQILNDETRSAVSTPHTEMSERSSNRSPAVVVPQFPVVRNQTDPSRSNTGTPNSVQNNNNSQAQQTNSDSQVPVVSWQNLKNNAEERQLHIRDGRRAFHPIIPPQSTRPRMMPYQQQAFPNNYPNNNALYQQANQMAASSSRNQGQHFRGRPRFNISANSVPFIPKFPDSFMNTSNTNNNNNNNPLAMNKNFHEKKVTDSNSGRQQRFMNNKPRKSSRFRSPSSDPKFTYPAPHLSSCPSQMMPQSQQMERPYDRPMMAVNSGQRWATNPPPPKRVVYNKRQNGSNPSLSSANNASAVRLNKKPSTTPEATENDVGGGGDAQPISQLALTPPSTPSKASNNQEVVSKMQALSLGTNS